jgi:uncharacterized protein YfeS
LDFAPILENSKVLGVMEAGFSGFMKNSNLIYSDLSTSVPSFQPFPSSSFWKQEETDREFSLTEGVKAMKDLENLLMATIKIDLAQ